jgi:protein CpxP
MNKSFLRLCLLGISLSTSYAATASVANATTLLLPPFFGQDTPRQGRPDGQRQPKGGGADQLKDLNLTEKQKTKVEAIMKKQRQEMEAMRKDNNESTDREARTTAMRRLDDDTNSQLKQVLTPEQYTKYQAKKKDRPQPPKDGQGRPPRKSES